MLYFVYGTLKRGFPNHRILYKENFIAHATTEGILYENGIIILYQTKNMLVFWIERFQGRC